ncbi:MAG: hypothetical protein LQ345_003508, partial [Seirophora villosa]
TRMGWVSPGEGAPPPFLIIAGTTSIPGNALTATTATAPTAAMRSGEKGADKEAEEGEAG